VGIGLIVSIDGVALTVELVSIEYDSNGLWLIVLIELILPIEFVGLPVRVSPGLIVATEGVTVTESLILTVEVWITLSLTEALVDILGESESERTGVLLVEADCEAIEAVDCTEGVTVSVGCV